MLSNRATLRTSPVLLASAACALHFCYYNFVWQVRTLGGPTPALAAGVTNRLWGVGDLVEGC